MGIATETLREYIVFAIDVVRRRWLLLLVPVLIAGIAGFTAVKLAPKKYTATSILLLQGANRAAGGGGPVQQLNALEQVRALDAWLKSDQVLTEILPQMSGFNPASTPADLLLQARILAASLSLDLIGNSVLQISLESRNPVGLGRNLEVVIARLMEGLTGPERNVLSASQFMQMRRSEDVALADAALKQAIDAAHLESPTRTRAALQQLWLLANGPTAATSVSPKTAETIKAVRQSISSDPTLVRELERLYSNYQMALTREDRVKRDASPNRGNYVSIFDSPGNLLVVGRPKDPLFGTSIAKKPAIGGILLSMLLAGGLVVLVELLNGRVRTRKEHENLAGLPVVARLGKIAPAHPA